MRIKTLVSAIAIALAAAVGSAYAAERFATLEAVSAQPMSTAELDSVRGQVIGEFNWSCFNVGCDGRSFTVTSESPLIAELDIIVHGGDGHGAHVTGCNSRSAAFTW